jgi:hypothetical protein
VRLHKRGRQLLKRSGVDDKRFLKLYAEMREDRHDLLWLAKRLDISTGSVRNWARSLGLEDQRTASHLCKHCRIPSELMDTTGQTNVRVRLKCPKCHYQSWSSLPEMLAEARVRGLPHTIPTHKDPKKKRELASVAKLSKAEQIR